MFIITIVYYCVSLISDISTIVDEIVTIYKQKETYKNVYLEMSILFLYVVYMNVKNVSAIRVK